MAESGNGMAEIGLFEKEIGEEELNTMADSGTVIAEIGLFEEIGEEELKGQEEMEKEEEGGEEGLEDAEGDEDDPDVQQSIQPLYSGPVSGTENGKPALKRSRDSDDGSRRKRSRPNPQDNESENTSRADESGKVVPPPSLGESATDTQEDSVREDISYQQEAITSNPQSKLRTLLPKPPSQVQPLPPTPASAPDPDSWRKRLETGIALHRQCYRDKKAQQAANRLEGFPRISLPLGLADDVTILAIATFWEALRVDGQRFAFAGVDVFAQTSNIDPAFRLTSQGVVGAPNKFIMPLLLHPQHEEGAKAANTAALGHLVLGLAEYLPDKKVRLEFVDSLARDVSASGIYRTGMIERAKKLITESRWPDGLENQAPSFLEEITTIPSPHQEGGDTCGFYMILNAWCVMLGIPICETPERRGDKHTLKQFLADGREIINLALMGCMEATTVQAFLNVWGYSEDQPLEDVVSRNVAAEAMNLGRLRHALYLQTIVDGRGPTVPQITNLVKGLGKDFGVEVSYAQMEAALDEKEGDADAAVDSLLQSLPVASTAGDASPPESEILRVHLKTQSPSPPAEGNVADASGGGL